MGTALPPNEPGNDCLACFGAGKPFGDVVTPKFISLKLTNLTPGPNWNSDHEVLLTYPHLLEQSTPACNWLLDDGVFGWQVIFHALTADILVQEIATVNDAFRAYFQPNCLLEYADDGQNPLHRFALDGVITIEWSTRGL